jgi:ElaB/YqjD/DUF883 family membrane-anchored ribosome-binding protein
MSKAMLFKPISYNNDEHRVNLQEKIKWLLNENTQNFHSFRVTMHTRHSYLINKIDSHFMQRVNSIWNGYIREQEQQTKQRITQKKQKEIMKIIDTLNKLLRSRNNLFIEKMKHDILKEIQFETNKEKRKKEFEENTVQNLYSQIVEPLEKKANRLEEEVKDMVRGNQDKIDEANRKFEKRKNDHLDNYEKEFHYKSMSETDLVSKTLKKAVPFLQAREKGFDDKLNYIKQEKGGSLAILRKQVAALEKEAKELDLKMAKIV